MLVNVYCCQKNAELLEYCPTLEVCTSYIYSSTFPLTMVCQFFKFRHPFLPKFSFSNLDGFLSLKCLILVHFLIIGHILILLVTSINIVSKYVHCLFFAVKNNFYFGILAWFCISIWGCYKMRYANFLYYLVLWWL